MGSSAAGADAEAVEERARKLRRREAVTREEEVQGRRWRMFKAGDEKIMKREFEKLKVRVAGCLLWNKAVCSWVDVVAAGGWCWVLCNYIIGYRVRDAVR